MKDQEILGEDSIPGQGQESGSDGRVLSLALWLRFPGIQEQGRVVFNHSGKRMTSFADGD